MSMPLLEIKVRENWQQITQRKIEESSRRWRLVQAMVVVSTLGVLLLMAFSQLAAWHGFFRMIVFPSVLLALPVGAAYHVRDDEEHGQWEYLLFGSIGFGILYSLLVAVAFRPNGNIFLWETPLSVLIPVITWSILAWMYRRSPEAMQQFGIDTSDWRRNVIIGAAIGITLGFHLLFVTNQMPGVLYPRVAAPVLLWTLFYQAGLGALAEELAFRGLGFHLLVHGIQKTPGEATVRILLLNLLIYLIPASSTQNLMTGLLVIVYGAALIVVTTVLRHRQRNLLVCIACNTAFSVFLGMVIA